MSQGQLFSQNFCILFTNYSFHNVYLIVLFLRNYVGLEINGTEELVLSSPPPKWGANKKFTYSKRVSFAHFKKFLKKPNLLFSPSPSFLKNKSKNRNVKGLISQNLLFFMIKIVLSKFNFSEVIVCISG